MTDYGWMTRRFFVATRRGRIRRYLLESKLRNLGFLVTNAHKGTRTKDGAKVWLIECYPMSKNVTTNVLVNNLTVVFSGYIYGTDEVYYY